jgi:hypothetical protein
VRAVAGLAGGHGGGAVELAYGGNSGEIAALAGTVFVTAVYSFVAG